MIRPLFFLSAESPLSFPSRLAVGEVALREMHTPTARRSRHCFSVYHKSPAGDRGASLATCIPGVPGSPSASGCSMTFPWACLFPLLLHACWSRTSIQAAAMQALTGCLCLHTTTHVLGTTDTKIVCSQNMCHGFQFP